MQSEESKNKVSRLRGKVEGLTGRQLNGWIWDESRPEAHLPFEVYIDGQSIASDVADDYRSDLAKAGIGNGGHAFTVLLPGLLFDGKRHDILVREAVTGRQLAPLEAVFFDAALRPEFKGNLESFEGGLIRGYVYNPNDVTAQIGIALCVDGREIIVGMADRPSPNKPAPQCAFEISLAEIDFSNFGSSDIKLITLPDRHVIASQLDLLKELARLSMQVVQGFLLLTVDLNVIPRAGAIFDVFIDEKLQMQLSCSALNPSNRLVGHIPIANLSEGMHSIAVRLNGTNREIGSSPQKYGRRPNLIVNASFEHWAGDIPDSWSLTLPTGAVAEPAYAVDAIAASQTTAIAALSISALPPASLNNTVISQEFPAPDYDMIDVIVTALADERATFRLCLTSNSAAIDDTKTTIAEGPIEQAMTVWSSWTTRRFSFRVPDVFRKSLIRLSIVIENSQGSRVSLRTLAAGAQGFDCENEARIEDLPATNAVRNGAMAYWNGSLRKTVRSPVTELAEGWVLSCKNPDLNVEARLTEIVTRDPKRAITGSLAHAIAITGTTSDRYIRLETELDALQLAAAPPRRLSFYAKAGTNHSVDPNLGARMTTISEITVVERRVSSQTSTLPNEITFSDERVFPIASRLNVRPLGETINVELDTANANELRRRVQGNLSSPDISYHLVFQLSNSFDFAITGVAFGKIDLEKVNPEPSGFVRIEDPNIAAQVGRLKGFNHWNEPRVFKAPTIGTNEPAEESASDARWTWPNISSKSVEIVICVHNALEETLECLASIRRCTDIPYTVTIINDASDPLVGDRLHFAIRDLPWMRILDTETNVGYTRAANMGLSSSNAEWIVLLNSDTIVTQNWLRGLFEVVDARPDVAMVGPLSNAASWQTVPDLYDVNNRWKVNAIPENLSIDRVAGYVRELSERRFPSVGLLNGFCTLMKKSVVEEVGLLDEKAFPQGYGEENDLCVRVGQAGYRLAIADHVYVYHVKSASFGRERRDALSKQGTLSFRAKHPNVDLNAITRSLAEETTLAEMRVKLRNRLASFEQNPSLANSRTMS